MEILRTSGLRLTQVEQNLSAELAGVEIAKLLEVQPGDPLLSLVRRSFDDNGNLVDILFGLYNPQRFQYQMSMSLDEKG